MHFDCAVTQICAVDLVKLMPTPLSLSLSVPTGCIKIVNLQGRLKSSRKLSAELTFNFQIESTGTKEKKNSHACSFKVTKIKPVT